jgi:hypothetical protein
MYKGKERNFMIEIVIFLSMVKKRDERGTSIILLPGVEIIPQLIFLWFVLVETVIMADSVKRIEHWAFLFIRLSKNLEQIGLAAFFG